MYTTLKLCLDSSCWSAWLFWTETFERRCISLQSPAVKNFWLICDQLVFKDGVMVYRWEDCIEYWFLLIVPDSLQAEVLHMNHDSRDSGHLGQRNTYLRSTKSFYWFRMNSSLYHYVKTCAKCNINKKPRRQCRAELGQYHVCAPMDRVMIDILGPLSKTPHGNTVILMLIDQFTKWIECFPLPDQSAELVAKTIVDEFFTCMGTTLEIHSDKGSNFVSNLFSTLCVLLQITKTRTTSYRPCSNGQIERMSRQVSQMIRC